MKKIIAILAVLLIMVACFLVFKYYPLAETSKQQNQKDLQLNTDPPIKIPSYDPEVKPLPVPKDPPKLTPLIPEKDKKTEDKK